MKNTETTFKEFTKTYIRNFPDKFRYLETPVQIYNVDDLLEPLKIAASKDAKSVSNALNDKICEERQYYQYHKLLSIMKNKSEFSNSYYTKANGQKISYEKGFQLASEFWDLRNKTMAKNILSIAGDNPGKKIIVLTGFMHRYYIINELNKNIKKDSDIVIKEFYD